MTEISLKTALSRGVRLRCPACGKGKLFASFTRVNDSCNACKQELHYHRADDAPPYIIIVLVGHIVVPLALIIEKLFSPPIVVHFALWIPLTMLLAIGLLPPVKGLIIAIQWANGMHGFGRS